MKSKNWLQPPISPALFWLCVFVCGCAVAEEPVKPPFEYYRLDKSQMVWGDETNSIKAGLMVVVVTNRPDARQNGVWCVPWLLFQTNSATQFYGGDGDSSSSNYFVRMRHGTISTEGALSVPYSSVSADIGQLVPIERNYEVRVTDANGMEVARTKRGEMLRNTFLDNPLYDNPGISGRYGRIYLRSGQLRPFVGNEPLHLNDFFNLAKTGKYRLQMQVRIFCHYGRVRGQKYFESFKPLFLPPIDVEFTVP